MATQNSRIVEVSLAGDKTDTYILGIGDYTVDFSQVNFMFGTQSKKVSGILKLSGVFLKKLFTIRGSNPIDMNEGTDFYSLIGGNISDQEEALLLIQNCLKDAQDQVKLDQLNQKVPSDETLVNVELASFEMPTVDSAYVIVNLYSSAGELATIKLPSAAY